MLQMTCEHKKDQSEKYKEPEKNSMKQYFFKYALSNTDPSTPVWETLQKEGFMGFWIRAIPLSLRKIKILKSPALKKPA